MLMDGRLSELIEEFHDSHVKRVARIIHDVTKTSVSFTQAARVAALAGCGTVGKECKIAFSYGTESDPVVAATFLAKLTRPTLHTHVPPLPPAYKSSFCPDPD